MQSLVYSFSEVAGKPYTVVGDEIKPDFTYVTDIVDGLVKRVQQTYHLR